MKRLDTFVSAKPKLTKIGSDLLAIIILGIPVLVLFLLGKPYERGFNCDDESIRYPYKDNTISSGLLYVYSTSIPIITIIIVEFLYFKQNERSIALEDGLTANPKYTDLLWQVYCRLSPFAFGALISQMTTDIAKYSIGRLRPHFIDVCRPRWDKEGITFTLDNYITCQEYEFKYITEFSCTSDYSESRKRDARLSFMSGHSSFAAYCLIYLVIYLQFRVKWTAIGFLRPLYQCLLIYLVIYTGFSRISDYKHHWSDVLIGLVQGTVVAILTTRFISDLFVKKPLNSSPNASLQNGNSIAINDKNLKRNPNYKTCAVEMDESSSS